VYAPICNELFGIRRISDHMRRFSVRAQGITVFPLLDDDECIGAKRRLNRPKVRHVDRAPVCNAARFGAARRPGFAVMTAST